MKKASIYLDYQSTTPVDPRVITEMLPYFFEVPGNPHASEHAFGWMANAAIEQARSTIACAIGADEDEILFTSGATESNNLAILGLAVGATSKRNRILTSTIEHKSVLSAARAAARKLGFNVELIPVNNQGVIRLECLMNMLKDDVLLVSVMGFNNEVGSPQPIAEIAELCHGVNAVFHSDGAQSLAAGVIDVGRIGLDMLSLSGHKIYGPKGIGALYISRNLHSFIEPIIYGGGQQEGLRSGTLPVPLCVGLAKAVSLMKTEDALAEQIQIAALRDRFVERLISILPGTRLVGLTGNARHPGNANVFLPEVDAADLLTRLQPRVAASTGAACTSGIPEPSHVLMALGLSQQEAESCIRFSFGRFSTKEHIDSATDAIQEVLGR